MMDCAIQLVELSKYTYSVLSGIKRPLEAHTQLLYIKLTKFQPRRLYQPWKTYLEAIHIISY
jgi:hypothetical protein